MSIDRRRLLKLTGSAAMGAALGAPFVSRGYAATEGWGELPQIWGVWDRDYKPKKILEIHCVGGVSPWETFWVHADAAGGPNFLAPGDGFGGGTVASMHWHRELCSGTPEPADQTIEFGKDAAGHTVLWGPATRPLWRPDIFNRCRLVVLRHGLAPHEAAQPLAITGSKLGSPRLAGTGAAVQHRASSLAPPNAPLRYPSSFVLSPSFIFDAPTLAAESGQHPAQPIFIRVGEGSFEQLLGRAGTTPPADRLLSVYAGQFRDRLRFRGAGPVTRSAGFQSYETALRYLFDAPKLQGLLSGGYLEVESGRMCATIAPTDTNLSDNVVHTELRLAARLLNEEIIRHVAVFDTGVGGGVGYDTHQKDHLDLTSAGVFRLCSELAAIIAPDNRAKGDGQISLKDTMVVINSEFGRSVRKDEVGGGRDHWPSGYAAVIIGGPVQRRGIAGGLDTTGYPTTGSGGRKDAFEPADLRGAMLLAAGINPFAPENFAVEDFSPAVNVGSESGIARNLHNLVLGA